MTKLAYALASFGGAKAEEGFGHESLSFLFRFTHKNLSVLDPSSRLSVAESNAPLFESLTQCMQMHCSPPHNKINRHQGGDFVSAEEERFELSVGFPTLVFKTSALDHYATPPSLREDGMIPPLSVSRPYGL